MDFGVDLTNIYIFNTGVWSLFDDFNFMCEQDDTTQWEGVYIDEQEALSRTARIDTLPISTSSAKNYRRTACL